MKRRLAACVLIIALLPQVLPGQPVDEADATWIIVSTRPEYEEVTGITPDSEDPAGWPRYPLPRQGEWDFNEFQLPLGQGTVLNDPVSFGIPNPAYPNGLLLPGLAFQSNTLPGGIVVSPRGSGGLIAFPPGGAFSSNVLLSNNGTDGLDILVTGPDPIYAFALDLVTNMPTPNVRVRIFSTTNALIGEFTAAGTPAGSFFAVIRGFDPLDATSIGRINLTALNPMGMPSTIREGVDNMVINATSY